MRQVASPAGHRLASGSSSAHHLAESGGSVAAARRVTVLILGRLLETLQCVSSQERVVDLVTEDDWLGALATEDLSGRLQTMLQSLGYPLRSRRTSALRVDESVHGVNAVARGNASHLSYISEAVIGLRSSVNAKIGGSRVVQLASASMEASTSGLGSLGLLYDTL